VFSRWLCEQGYDAQIVQLNLAQTPMRGECNDRFVPKVCPLAKDSLQPCLPAVDQSTKTTVKVAAMARVFRTATDSDKLCASPCFPAAAHAA
jgi:hypothetical protein